MTRRSSVWRCRHLITLFGAARAHIFAFFPMFVICCFVSNVSYFSCPPHRACRAEDDCADTVVATVAELEEQLAAAEAALEPLEVSRTELLGSLEWLQGKNAKLAEVRGAEAAGHPPSRAPTPLHAVRRVS